MHTQTTTKTVHKSLNETNKRAWLTEWCYKNDSSLNDII